MIRFCRLLPRLPGSVLSSEAAAFSAAAGCPAAASFASTAGSAFPVARYRFPSRPTARPKVRCLASRSLSYRPRFHLVNPVGPPLHVTAIAGCLVLRHRSSGPGWRALSGTRITLHPTFPLVKGYFRSSQGYPQGKRLTHRTFSFIHCSHTGCTQGSTSQHGFDVDADSISGLNESHVVAHAIWFALGHRRCDHYHLLAHVGPDADVRTPAAPWGGSFISAVKSSLRTSRYQAAKHKSLPRRVSREFETASGRSVRHNVA